jgi:hypothetical protein
MQIQNSPKYLKTRYGKYGILHTNTADGNSIIITGKDKQDLTYSLDTVNKVSYLGLIQTDCL